MCLHKVQSYKVQIINVKLVLMKYIFIKIVLNSLNSSNKVKFIIISFIKTRILFQLTLPHIWDKVVFLVFSFQVEF